MQETKETAAEAKAERLRHFGLVMQRCIVELQLVERIAQRLVLVRLDRIEPGEHLGLHILEPRKGGGCGSSRKRDGIADFRRVDLLDAGDDEADLTCRQRRARDRLGREHADLLASVGGAGCHQQELVLRLQRAVHHAHEHHDANVVVEPRVDDQC